VPLRAELAHARGSVALGASALTAAELRLLPLLATHLSVSEIAEEMFVSRNTVKSHTSSIYRKLGTSHAARPSPGCASSGSSKREGPAFTPSGRWNSPRREVDWCYRRGLVLSAARGPWT
jgi:DNA-binding CsgD family transcriptional regulator